MTPIEQMQAVEEIKQLKARYFRCLDKQDWDGYDTVFASDATIDASEVFTPMDATGALRPIDGHDTPLPDSRWAYGSPKEFVDDLRVQNKGVITVHHGHMPEITFTSPTTASGMWAMEDRVLWPKGSPMRELHGYGHYIETYERGPHGWRIKTLKLTRLRVDLTK
jgi:hypothetical protein